MHKLSKAETIESGDDLLKRRLLDFDFFLLCIAIALFGNAVIEIINISGL